MKLVVTCEHGGNKIPKAYQSLFKDCDALQSHRGYDLGTLDVFKHLKPLADASKYSQTSRLLIELNRSIHHNNLFSEFSKLLSKTEKETLISSYYLEYRNDVELTIRDYIKENQTVLHFSIHSFTPKLNGKERDCDIGLLYDSRKVEEKTFCREFKKELLKLDDTLNVRFNYPYLGKADGFTTYLRKQFPNNYIGIELEFNHKYTQNDSVDLKTKNSLFTTLMLMMNQKATRLS